MSTEDRRAALEDFTGCIEAAMEVYTPTGALLALVMGNANFGGESAVELIARGETDRVRDWLQSLTGMVAT